MGRSGNPQGGMRLFSFLCRLPRCQSATELGHMLLPCSRVGKYTKQATAARTARIWEGIWEGIVGRGFPFGPGGNTPTNLHHYQHDVALCCWFLVNPITRGASRQARRSASTGREERQRARKLSGFLVGRLSPGLQFMHRDVLMPRDAWPRRDMGGASSAVL